MVALFELNPQAFLVWSITQIWSYVKIGPKLLVRNFY